MTKTYCDDCGDQLGSYHPSATLPAPYDHPEHGAPFLMKLDFCASCCSTLLAAYASANSDAIGFFWMKVADRRGWEIPWGTIVRLAYDGRPTGVTRESGINDTSCYDAVADSRRARDTAAPADRTTDRTSAPYEAGTDGQ